MVKTGISHPLTSFDWLVIQEYCVCDIFWDYLAINLNYSDLLSDSVCILTIGVHLLPMLKAIIPYY